MELTGKSIHVLKGGGEMGERTRNFDWSKTSIGALEQWPLSLKTIVNIILNSKFPMFLWWGKDLIQFYNDAYRPSLGDDGKHPSALGEKGDVTWTEIWPVIHPLMAKVFETGESIWMEDQLIPIYRNGRLENVYWTFSYSPAPDDNGDIGGVLVTCTETTAAVLNMQKIKLSNAELKQSLADKIAIQKVQSEIDFKFKNVTNSSPTGLWLSNEKGELTYVNKTLSQWTGISNNELLGSGWLNVIVEEDRSYAKDAFAKAISNLSHYDIEFRITKKDGTKCWCRASGDPFYLEEGTYAGYAGFCMDIQSHFEAKQQLIESEQRFFNLAKQASIGIVVLIGDEMKIDIANDAYAHLIGRTSEELIGKKLFDIIPETREVFAPIIQNVKETGVSLYLYNKHYSINMPGKSEGYLNLVYQPYKENDGRITGVIILCQDVTTQVVALKQLEKNEARLSAIIEKTPVATALFQGKDFIIEVANDVMIGYWQKGKDVIGKPYRKAVPELEGQGYFDILAEIFETGKEYHATASRADIIENGSVKTSYFDYSYTPLFDEKGNVYAVLNMGYDVTATIIAQRQREENQQKLLSFFEDSPVGIAIISGPDLKFEMANTFFGMLTGREPKQLNGRTLMEAIPELAGQGFDDQLNKVLQTGETITAKEVPVQFVRNEKPEIIYIDYTYQPQRNNEGETNAVLVVVIEVTEQVLARRKIEDSEARFRKLIQEAPFGTCLYVGREMRIEIANKIIMDYWGKGTGVIGKTMLEAMPEMKNQIFPKLLDDVFTTGKLFEQKGARAKLMINGKLQTFYFDFTYKPLLDSNGEVYAILDIAVDVTAQIKANQKLQESEEFSRMVFYNSPVAKLVYIGPEMIVREANEKMLEIFGRDESIIGKPILETIPELKKTQCFEKYTNALATGMVYKEFAEPLTFVRDGVPVIGYYDYTYKPLVDNSGTVYGVICIAIEVTDQLLARQKQQEAEANLRGAVELAELGTWNINTTTFEVGYSDRLIEWFGYDPKDQNYSEIISIIEKEDQERVFNAIKWAINPKSGGLFDEIYRITNYKTGQKRILHAQGKTIFDAEGNPLKINGTAQDITIQHQTQVELENEVQNRTEELAEVVHKLRETNESLAESNTQLVHSNGELAQFAYIASHDLQEPLRKISTFSQMLQSTLGEDVSPGAKNYIDKIINSSMRMRTLINDVLNYSQLTKFEEHIVPVDLTEIVKNLIIDYDLLIEQKRAIVKYEQLPTIEAIPLQMMQLFRNLIGNALKFSKEGVDPIITIDLVPLDKNDLETYGLALNLNYFKIRIKDNGIGFHSDYFNKIFNIFQRLHSKSEYEGTGIGLAMCKKIAQNHRGDIYAEGSLEGGATFYIFLSIAAN